MAIFNVSGMEIKYTQDTVKADNIRDAIKRKYSKKFQVLKMEEINDS